MTHISVVVPVLNGAEQLAQCLARLTACGNSTTEIVVVDDGSTDDSARVAVAAGARLVRLAQTSGPAAARNHGARAAKGDVLFFVDADVVVAPDALDRVARVFEAHPDVAAVFGSYDARPAAAGTVSQYRNLLHHFVHQQGNPEASTFWAGCGAIRRSVFEAIGGFDAARFRYPSIEDIELGSRMRRAGYRIVLDRELQGTHLKRWTLRSVIQTDVTRRAIPWARLIVESGGAPDDLNLKRAQRASAALLVLACALTPLVAFRPGWAVAPLLALSIVIGLNHRLYRFFAHHGGYRFAAACVAMHFLYYLYSVLAYAYVWAAMRVRSAAARTDVRRVAVSPKS